MDLSKDELAFLARHGFGDDQIYDGRWMSKDERSRNAREAGLDLVLSSKRCRAAGHRIRTRAGHCAQCNTANIGFTKRERSAGYVYIAGTPTGRLIKIGTASDLDQRETQLRAERYGGFGDWKILAAQQVDDAGLQERNVANRTSGERVAAPYLKNGAVQYSKEMIRCSLESAINAFEATLGEIWNRDYLLRKYKRYGQ